MSIAQDQNLQENTELIRQKKLYQYIQDILIHTGNIEKFRAGKLTEDEFRKLRLLKGVYGQKQDNIQMVRVKIPEGILNAAQLRVMAEIAEEFPGEDRRGIGHLSTRQNIQFHFVPLEKTPEIMKKLQAVGITTSEACGNSVRNVTACPLAGVCQHEKFDVTPYGERVSWSFLQTPIAQGLPRKFKIAFSGCAHDCAVAGIHDIGFIASQNDKGERGFTVYAGAGLGAIPKVGVLVSGFLPERFVTSLSEAILKLFDRDGNRKSTNFARLKFLVEKLGREGFLKAISAENPELAPYLGTPRTDACPNPGYPREKSIFSAGGSEYDKFLATNVTDQREPGKVAVICKLVLGDLTTAQFRALATLVETYGDGTLRISIFQNFFIRNIPRGKLPEVYEFLRKNGMADWGAETVADVTCCPGADTCRLGITSSRGLTRAIAEVVSNGPSQEEGLRDVKIKISGCINSCAQHHIADIGFFGATTTQEGKMIPAYQMMFGGCGQAGNTHYGKGIVKVPAKAIPNVLTSLFDLYRREKRRDNGFVEPFAACMERLGKERVVAEVAPAIERAPADLSDWGADADYKLNVMKGECAS